MAGDDAALPSTPAPDAVPDVRDVDADGAVVWHREHLRTADQLAVARAAAADLLCPLFVFDPRFYGSRGLSCDARLAVLHDSLDDLDRQYRAVSDDDVGLTFCHGDPLAVLDRFRDRGWDVFAMDCPTGRYGRRRDAAAARRGGTFVDGDGLVRGTDRTRRNWQETVESFLTAERFDWDPATVELVEVPTAATPERVAEAYDVTPRKTMVPEGGTRRAVETLSDFVGDIGSYPGAISSPVDARTGTSGLSPYLKYGCLSVRQAYQHVQDHAPACRGRELFVSRLFWNLHYRQKVLDWPGWLDSAVNPVLEAFNGDRHDEALVERWKRGTTGYPMVDASMRCLRETGWLNFRMRAMCASFYYHVLHQPWWIGADYFHQELVDSVAAINYTQWQSQCGLVGKPGLRLYNPRKQVRDQDPDGEFITRWVPELDALPTEFLDRPERTPEAVQRDSGVVVGETYPYPVKQYEPAKEAFWRRYEAVQGEAAAALGDETVARRASLSGGVAGARAIAEEYGVTDPDGPTETQADLSAFSG